MVRTIVLTVLIVIGAAVGGYALWTTSQSDVEAAAESLSNAAPTACASATGAGCEGCPSAMAAEATAAAPPACASELGTSDVADCEGCPSMKTCADVEGCVDDAECTCEGDCTCGTDCGGNPATCTAEMKAACGEKCVSPDAS